MYKDVYCVLGERLLWQLRAQHLDCLHLGQITGVGGITWQILCILKLLNLVSLLSFNKF